MRILFSRNFAYAKFRENNTIAKISKFTVPQVELTFYASQTVLIISADGHAYTGWLPLLTDTASTSVVGVRDPGVPYHLFGIFSARIWRQKCPICRNDNDIQWIMKNTLVLMSSLSKLFLFIETSIFFLSSLWYHQCYCLCLLKSN